jgi:hypothetical protein
MYLCVIGISFVSFYDFSIGFWAFGQCTIFGFSFHCISPLLSSYTFTAVRNHSISCYFSTNLTAKTKGQTMIYNQKDKQYNGQKKKDQGTNNDLQTGQTIQWTKEKRPRDKQ